MKTQIFPNHEIFDTQQFASDANPASTMLAAHTGVPRGHRSMSREQGRALETVGHAVDYLLDTHIHETGARQDVDGERAAEIEAICILTRSRCSLLQSLPLVEPLGRRIRRAVGNYASLLKTVLQYPPGT